MSDLWIIYSSAHDTNEDNSAKRMLNAALDYNIQAKLMFYQYFEIEMEELLYQKKIINELPKVVFMRAHEIKLIKYFEEHGIEVINNLNSTVNCKDKWKTFSILEGINVKQPKTMLLASKNYSEIMSYFQNKFLLKYRYGAQGKDIYLIENEKQFAHVMEIINKEDYIVQEFINASYGKDLRVYIIGDKVIGGVERRNENGFMSNIARGGLSYHYELDDETISTSLRIARTLQGEIISVDYLFGEGELVFCEANTNAGFASFNFLGYPMRDYMMKYIVSVLAKK